MNRRILASVVLASLISPVTALACNAVSGEREQLVYLSWSNQLLTYWVASHGSMKEVDLPNGVRLGVRLDKPGLGEIPEASGEARYTPEMVRIDLYDLSGAAPVQLTRTYGGSNSMQGYGARGGASRVDSLGDPGIKLLLLKPVCEGVAQVDP